MVVSRWVSGGCAALVLPRCGRGSRRFRDACPAGPGHGCADKSSRPRKARPRVVAVLIRRSFLREHLTRRGKAPRTRCARRPGSSTTSGHGTTATRLVFQLLGADGDPMTRCRRWPPRLRRPGCRCCRCLRRRRRRDQPRPALVVQPRTRRPMADHRGRPRLSVSELKQQILDDSSLRGSAPTRYRPVQAGVVASFVVRNAGYWCGSWASSWPHL